MIYRWRNIGLAFLGLQQQPAAKQEKRQHQQCSFEEGLHLLIIVRWAHSTQIQLGLAG
jgi:hypothetical protein